ncbi:FtsX-like permease family protein [Enterococcus saccharolyticus]|uniref:ABC3 transporter permease C-terminal domain-containing protein n=1 Tax=Candidatus Enterococcus willemsii TaxID=1857215 RepID=A0ABQ6Z048_9ENTE|nr:MULTISPECIES: FtsX-like permease family protein [Enterococcus]KAF1304282.1 hypothetical protein BAU17_12765 [Enterococcus sp. CU12B]MCD5003382.1 FtsX-like permease family protein [Enterococcus saccharolyticus]
MFYTKLATRNILKNKPVYFPFLFSMIFIVILNFLMYVMLKNEGMTKMPNAQAVRSMFNLGLIVIMIFSVIFSIYTNGFLNKHRKKELGLYNVLGLDKKAIGWMLFIESILSFLLSLGGGLLIGSIFSKYLFLILKKLTGFGEHFTFQLTAEMFYLTALFHAFIFLSLFLINLLSLRRANPTELLRGSNVGEREPKARWFLSVIGLICLGIGYYLSLTIESPLSALYTFFYAILLVIFGTYIVMITFSISLLKFLKNRSSIYYRPKAFINISGMLYRMKQNGMGLASICVLSTMVLVTISSTVGLFAGKEDSLRNQHPFDMQLGTQTTGEAIEPKLTELMEEYTITPDEFFVFNDYVELPTLVKEGTKFNESSQRDFLEKQKGANLNLVDMEIMTAEEYEMFSGKKIILSADDAYVYTSAEQLDELQLGTKTFQVTALDDFPFSTHEASLIDRYTVVVKDRSVLEDIVMNSQINTTIGTRIALNFTAEGDRESFVEAVSRFVQELNANAGETTEMYAYFESIDQSRKDMSELVGGFLFIGVIFSLSFIVATGLIIYYKQISEGYEDAYRFEVMQKVGMSHKEVKQTIRSQVLMVFFFPLLLAIVHLLFASPIIQKLLLIFGFHNQTLYIMVTALGILVFSLCYFIVYLQTSKIYYQIVERQHS